MSKIRVYELAKELGLESKAVVAAALELGFQVKNHMSSLEEEQGARVKEALAKGPGEAEPEAQPAVEQAEAVVEVKRAKKPPRDPDAQPTEEEEARQRDRDHRMGRSSSLGQDDPFWQFGTPVESWGSTRKNKPTGHGQGPRQRGYIECRTCGVKIEKKRAHFGKKVPCPFCNKWMRDVR